MPCGEFFWLFQAQNSFSGIIFAYNIVQDTQTHCGIQTLGLTTGQFDAAKDEAAFLIFEAVNGVFL